MKNARGASKKQKKKKKKNQNRQNRAASEPTRAESTGGELSDIEAKPRAAEAVAAHESAEPELKPAAAPSLSLDIIPATPPAPPTPAVASASPSSPQPSRHCSTIKLGVPLPIVEQPSASTILAASLKPADDEDAPGGRGKRRRGRRRSRVGGSRQRRWRRERWRRAWQQQRGRWRRG